ncbi:hypothetical protein Dimus_008639, partial [Dionaea muscipula]
MEQNQTRHSTMENDGLPQEKNSVVCSYQLKMEVSNTDNFKSVCRLPDNLTVSFVVLLGSSDLPSPSGARAGQVEGGTVR